MFFKKLGVRLKYIYLRLLEENIFWTLTQIIIRLCNLLIYLLLFPVTLVLRILGYRFLNVNTARIGHLAGEVDCFLKMQRLGLIDDSYKYFVFNTASICNTVFWGYIKKEISTIDSPTLCYLLRAMCFAPGVRFNVSDYLLSLNRSAKYYEVCRSWGDRPPIFTLDPEHIALGVKTLNALGVPIGAPYVCIHVRSRGYANRDDKVHGHRNFSLGTYDDAVNEIVSRGCYCILMGDHNSPKIQAKSMVIDYAHSNHRSSLVDVFLCGSAKFFLGNSSGLFILSTVYGVPCALTNMLPFACTGFTSKDISIPKLLRFFGENNYLSYSKILSSGIANYRNSRQYDIKNIEVVSNTSEDILNLVCEMFAMLNGKLNIGRINTGNAEFFKRLQQDNYCYGSASNISPSFLKKYSEIFYPK